MNSPLDILNAYIKQHKLRRTYERERVLEYILTIDGHFTIQSVHEKMNKETPISRGSIYNIIELFLNAGIVVRHPFAGAEAEYETTMRAATHHHRICTSCGAIKEFSDQKFNKAIKNRTFASFEKRFHSIYLYGLCKKCQPKTKKTKK
ncbi:MAG: transcriptional repressor [Paludibacteraceae bacterium]|nr:transcriptional repressor [Paludibacteraceae bacterium]